jgi:tetratricopeptide (TPR) repeat protein
MMDAFNNMLIGALLSAFLALILTLLPIWLGKKPIQRSLYKIAAIIIIIVIISVLSSYTMYPRPPLQSGIDTESTDIKAAWNNGGVALFEQKNYAGAIKYYDRAIEIDSDYVLAWSNKGNALKAQLYNTEANKAFAKARGGI